MRHRTKVERTMVCNYQLMIEPVYGIYVGPFEEAPDGGQWVKIRRGVYLDQGSLPDLPYWEINRHITRARMVGVSQTRLVDESLPVFTGECALIAQGVNTWLGAADLTAWRADGTPKYSACRLPEMVIDDHKVPPVTYSSRDGRRVGCENAQSLQLETTMPTEAILDLIRGGHPVQVFAAAGDIMRKVSGYTNSQQQRTRPLAEAFRDELMGMVVNLRKFRKRAVELVSAIDPGVYGPGEAFLRWVLLSISDLQLVQTQFPVRIRGLRYFLDAAIPSKKCCFEFDGSSKSGTPESQVEFTRRQQNLTNAGWKIYRLTWSSIYQWMRTVHEIAVFLAGNGVPVTRPLRHTWVALPSGLLVRERW